jgi:hypothetical protein
MFVCMCLAFCRAANRAEQSDAYQWLRASRFCLVHAPDPASLQRSFSFTLFCLAPRFVAVVPPRALSSAGGAVIRFSTDGAAYPPNAVTQIHISYGLCCLICTLFLQFHVHFQGRLRMRCYSRPFRATLSCESVIAAWAVDCHGAMLVQTGQAPSRLKSTAGAQFSAREYPALAFIVAFGLALA